MRNLGRALYTQVKSGTVPNATGMERDWSSAGELTRDFSVDLSAAVFPLAAGESTFIPAARGWYFSKIEGHEVRTMTEEWRKARGEDAFPDWLAHQQVRVTQFPRWMERVPLMAGVPLNQGAVPMPGLPSQLKAGGQGSPSVGPQFGGAPSSNAPADKWGEGNSPNSATPKGVSPAFGAWSLFLKPSVSEAEKCFFLLGKIRFLYELDGANSFSKSESTLLTAGSESAESLIDKKDVGFGIWKNKRVDSREFVDKLRAEWSE